jgi:hypothetical protein
MPLFRALAKDMAARYAQKKLPCVFFAEVRRLYVITLWYYFSFTYLLYFSRTFLSRPQHNHITLDQQVSRNIDQFILAICPN